MQWENMRRSGNVEDRRGMIPGGGMGLGLGGIIMVVVISLLLGKNPLEILSLLSSGGTTTAEQAPGQAPPANDKQSDFVKAVLGDTEDTWTALMQKSGHQYHDPKLVLFTQAVQSACGTASSAVGPFYCPGDQQVYLDLSFFQELSQRFGAPGDFANAYVIAHEIGHHVQNELGVSAQVDAQRGRIGKEQANALSVRVELQADCYAGVWGHYAQKRGLVDFSDVRAALAAASAIGDDKLQMQSQGYVAPESFTHGSAEQRAQWFTKGLQSGDPNSCNTFQASS